MVLRPPVFVALFAMVVAAIMGCGREAPPQTPKRVTRERPPARAIAILCPEEAAALIERLQIPPFTGDPNKDRQAARDRVRAATALANARGANVIGALVNSRDHDPYWEVYRAAKSSLAKVDPKRFRLAGEEQARQLVAIISRPRGRIYPRDADLSRLRAQVLWPARPLRPSEQMQRARQRVFGVFPPMLGERRPWLSPYWDEVAQAWQELMDIGAPAVEILLEAPPRKATGLTSRHVRSILVRIGDEAVGPLTIAAERRHLAPEVKRTAQAALRELRPSTEEVAKLIRQLRIPPLTSDREKNLQAPGERRRAAMKLAGARGDHVVAALEHARDHDPYWQVYRAAKRSLAKIDPGRFGLPHEEEAARLVAVLEKIETPPEGAENYIRQTRGVIAVSLTPRDFAPKAEIEEAQRRLIAMGAPAVEPMLDDCWRLDTGPSGPRIWSILEAIGRDAVPALAVFLERQNVCGKLRIIRVAGEIADPRALPALRRLAKIGNYPWKTDAEEAVARIELLSLRRKGPEAAPQLIAAIERYRFMREVEVPRRLAIEALGDMRDPRALPLLHKIAKRGESYSARSLEGLDGRAAKEAIAKIEGAGGD